MLQQNINQATKPIFPMIWKSVNESVSPLEETANEVIDEVTSTYSLVVWNDEVNTFEWVIETLIKICKHSTDQAEQCAMLIHTQGKYAVKKGDYDTLKSMCDAITERGIEATVEVVNS